MGSQAHSLSLRKHKVGHACVLTQSPYKKHRCSNRGLLAVGEPQLVADRQRLQRVSVNLAVDDRLRRPSGCRRSSMLSTVFHVSGRWGQTAGSTQPIDRQVMMTLADADRDWWRRVLKSTTDVDGPHWWCSLIMNEDGGWWWRVLTMRSHDDDDVEDIYKSMTNYLQVDRKLNPSSE